MATQRQETAESARFYWADGEKIPLNPSGHFITVMGKSADEGGSNAAHAAAESLISTLSPMEQHVDVLDVPEHGFTVVALRNGTIDQPTASKDPARIEALAGTLQSIIDQRADVSEGPPVFESLTTGPQTALIPVGEIVVRMAEGVNEDQRKRLFSKHKVEIKEADVPVPGCFLLTIKGKQDTIAVANALQDSELVEHSEPNFVILAPRLDHLLHPEEFSGDQPTDLMSGGFLHHTAPDLAEFGPQAADLEAIADPQVGPAADPGFTSQWNLMKIRAPQAWAISQGRSDIAIAVLDEGCDLNHEDIRYKLPGYDAYAGDTNAQPEGNDAHGTACAGVVAMKRNNAKGGVGVAPGCQIVPIRIAKGIGGGRWDTTSLKVATGIFRSFQSPRNADVLSNSYGLAPSSIVSAAFNAARTQGRGGKGCCIAAAAGNSNTPPVLYPARLSSTIPGMMAVSATNQWDQRKSKTSLDGEWWWGSSFGPEVDIAAPGVKIYAPDITGAAGYASGNYVPNFNGTSSATPHVAGLMALILSVDPGLRSWEVEDIIKLTADDLGPAGRDQEFGFGRINCRRALEAASRIWYQITVQPVFLGSGRDCFMRATARMYNPGINTVRLDSLTMRSFTSNWATEIDRWEYRPQPGNVLRSRTGDDVRFRRILLKANGNRASYTYRWSLNWTYTFWRPTAPGFALGANADVLADAQAQQVTAPPVRGSGGTGAEAGAQPSDGPAEAYPTPVVANGHNPGFQAEVAGDSITIDRASKSITVVVR